MRKLISLMLVSGILFLFMSCQEVFTYAPLESLARDPSSLSADQQVTYAETVLSSGSAEEIEAAYTAITAQLANDPEDPELNLLAADLAIAGSGLDDAINTALATPELLSGDLDAAELETVVTDILDSLDVSRIEDAGNFVLAAAADEDAEISDSQIVVAGASLILSAASDAGGFEELATLEEGESGYEQLQDAQQIIGDADVESLLGGLLGEDFSLPEGF